MIIEYKENPLASVVHLDKNERREMRWNIKLSWIQERVEDLEFALDPKYRQLKGTMCGIMNKSLEEQVRDELATLDTSWLFDGEARNGTTLEMRLDECLEFNLKQLVEQHVGDCCCVPAQCLKCEAERFASVNTIKGLEKYAATFIRTQMEGGKGIDETIAFLRDYQPTFRSLAEQTCFEVYAPQWTKDAKSAHDWLAGYKQEHLPWLE